MPILNGIIKGKPVQFAGPLLVALILWWSCGPARKDPTTLATEGITAKAWGTPVEAPARAEIRDTSSPYFKNVKFYFAELPMEHGGTVRRTVAIDTDGQLYLLDSPSSFRLLVHRHFSGPLAAGSLVDYAILAAELTGLWDRTSVGPQQSPDRIVSRKVQTLRIGPETYRVGFAIPSADSVRWLEMVVNTRTGMADPIGHAD